MAPNLTEKKSDPTGLIGSTYLLFGISQNKHVYGDACLGLVKLHSALDAAVASSDRDITEKDKVSFRGSIGTVTNIRDNNGEKYILLLTYLFGVKPSSQSIVFPF